MKIRCTLALSAVTLSLLACVPPGDPAARNATEPPEARDGVCYARGISRGTPEQIAAGRPQPSAETWFETPCALQNGDSGFIADLQRALQARGLYEGDIDGIYNADTRSAVLRLQDPRGLASGTLSTDTARLLGLIALGRPA